MASSKDDIGGNQKESGMRRVASITSMAMETRAWQDAAPFEQIPRVTAFTMLRQMMGKRYQNQHVDLVKVFSSLRQNVGELMLIKGIFGQEDILVTHNPNDFEKIFRHEGIWPDRPGLECLKYHRSVHRADFFQGEEGIIATKDKQWGSFRSKVNPILLKPENVRLYQDKMSEVNKDFMNRIRELRDPLTFEVPGNEFYETINCWTLESVSLVALNRRLNLLEDGIRDNALAQNLFQALKEFFQYSVQLEFFPSVWRYIPTLAYKRTMKALDIITDTAYFYVSEAVRRIERDQNHSTIVGGKSVLEKLIQVDKKVAIVMAMDLLLAGVDTTSSIFFGLLLCMAKNPEKQEKLRQEIREILPDKDSEFEKDALEKIPFLKACIKETMRCYPLTPGNARIVQKDVVLSGYQVPKGTNTFMFAIDLLKNEKLYPKANTYLPERWLRTRNQDQFAGDVKNHTDSSPSSNTVSTVCPSIPGKKYASSDYPFVYLPFGFGTRSCIGRRIVEMELQLGLARLIRNFYVDYPYPTENAYKSLLINVPNIPLTFQFKDVEN